MKVRNIIWIMLFSTILFLPVSLWAIEIDVTRAPYNAVPNDGISDRAAIQAAINSLPAEGGAILFPAGTYDLDGDLVISDDDTWPTALRDKPVFLKGSTYGGSGDVGRDNCGSVLRRTSAGNILRVNLNSSNYGYNKMYTKLSVANMTFQGDPNHSNQVTAIRGYHSRINLQNITIIDCYNGIYMNNNGAAGMDCSDGSVLVNLRFQGGWEGKGIYIREGHATTMNGIYMETNSYSEGIYLLNTKGMSMSNLLINEVPNAIRLDNCLGIGIYGWHSEGTGMGLYTMGGSGISVEGFQFSQNDNMTRFWLDGTVGVKIRSGFIDGTAGLDLKTTGTTRNVEFDNVSIYSSGWTARTPFFNLVETAHGKYAGTTSDLNGLPFIQLKGSDKTTTLFEVSSTGEMVLAGGVKILTGAGVPAGTPPVGSLYLRNNGGPHTTLYVMTSSGWVAK